MRPTVELRTLLDESPPETVALGEALRQAFTAIHELAVACELATAHPAFPFERAPYLRLAHELEELLEHDVTVRVPTGTESPDVVACRLLATVAGVATDGAWDEDAWHAMVDAAEAWGARDVWLVSEASAVGVDSSTP